MTIWNYLYGFPIHFLRITPESTFDYGLRSGRERQVVNIRFQQSWNLILLFVIVGLDPTIQKISDSLSQRQLVLVLPTNRR
jgi:hypothetical protein